MAVGRKIKKGLDYFQIDTHIFSDIKIRKLIKYANPNAVSIYICLLAMIYKDGYYIKWDEDMPFIVSEETGINEEEIKQTLTILLKVSLFSEALFQEYQILTSKGIQERYQRINIISKRKSNVTEFSLIGSEETSIDSEETAIDSEEAIDTSDLSTQKKRKEKKKEEKKINSIDAADSRALDPSFDSYQHKPLDKLKLLLLDSKIWHLAVAKSLGIENPENISRWIEKFFDHVAASGTETTSESEAKKHCLNWIRKQIEMGASLISTANKPQKITAIERRYLKQEIENV